MWAFILGLLVGFAGKAVYDLFRDEQLPAGLDLNSGRLEALLDETRQSVRDLREEVRQAVSSGKEAVKEQADRLLQSSGPSEADVSAERLSVTGNEPEGEKASKSSKPTGGTRSQSDQRPTRGTRETMS